MSHTDREPAPRLDGRSVRAAPPAWPQSIVLPDPQPPSARDFLDVLRSRSSSVRGPIAPGELGAVLREATRLRYRRADGRFGFWESRPYPGAGGLHAIGLLALPLEAEAPAGWYDDAGHVLRHPGDLRGALDLNIESAAALTGACSGTTIQLVADRSAYDGCYEGSDTLVWRDAGAICATLALVATALGLGSVVLGRVGDDVVSAAGLAAPWSGAGAVHLTGPS